MYILTIILTIIALFATYNLWHHDSVLIFISVLILSFLVSYKVVSYIAQFKTVKHCSKIDIIFLLIFFIILCIPVSHIDKSKSSKAENRKLAPKPKLMVKKKLNLNYGKDFNKWFNDRFYLRKNAIRANMLLACTINANNCKSGGIIYNKKNNLIYRENFWGMEPIYEDKGDILQTYVGNLNKLQEYCEANNISLYFLIIPRQADYFNFDMSDKRKYLPDPADEVIDYIKANSDLKIVYPKKEMAEANKMTPVYFKTDHHWTKKGAYVGYREILKEIQKDYSDIKILDDNKLEKYYDKRVSEWWDKKFNYGQMFRRMNLPKFYVKKVLNTLYLYYKNPEFDYLEKIDFEFKEYGRDVQFKYSKGAKERILVIGDSFGCNFLEFLPYSFIESLYLYNNPRGLTFKNYEPTIEKYKPDIILLLFYTHNVPKFLDLYPNKYSKIMKIKKGMV